MHNYKKTYLRIVEIGIFCFAAFLVGTATSYLKTAHTTEAQNTLTTTGVNSGFVFFRDLRQGDTLEDVRQLQIVLNSDPETRIAATGIGSPGQESTYFGALTRQAVAKFQKKYQIDAASTEGLKKGAYVGPLSRLALNLVMNRANTIQNSASNTQFTPVNALGTTSFDGIDGGVIQLSTTTLSVGQPAIANNGSKSRIYQVLPYEVSPTSTITIAGDNFEPYTTVIVGNTVFKNVPVVDGQNITLNLAAQPMSLGEYTVTVQTSAGLSIDLGLPNKIKVLAEPKPAPVVKSVNITTARLTDTIILTGTGFSPQNNQVLAGFGDPLTVPSSNDGTEIRFILGQIVTTGVPEIRNFGGSGSSMQIGIYVMTEHGLSKEPVLINVVF